MRCLTNYSACESSTMSPFSCNSVCGRTWGCTLHSTPSWQCCSSTLLSQHSSQKKHCAVCASHMLATDQVGCVRRWPGRGLRRSRRWQRWAGADGRGCLISQGLLLEFPPGLSSAHLSARSDLSETRSGSDSFNPLCQFINSCRPYCPDFRL